jgi:hypothetical protein
MGHFARWVLENPYTLGFLGYILIVLPIMGIWAIHKYGWQHWEPFGKNNNHNHSK